MKNLGKLMKYPSIDQILRDAEILLRQCSTVQDTRYELPAPFIFELSDPMARFSCSADNRKSVAISAAESLYFLSGMNGNDFIWEFREWENPKTNQRQEPSHGLELRFQGQAPEILVNYDWSILLRQRAVGFTDQLENAVEKLKDDKTAKGAVIQFASVKNPLSVHGVWFRREKDKLEMSVSAGLVNIYTELGQKVVSPFAFLHQIVSDLTEIPMGSSCFMIGCLYAEQSLTHSTFQKFPEINMANFRYPNSKLTLRDVDTLMSLMIEFVSRLDENSLMRANPFEGDPRVQLYSDYAEIFRAWRAEKLGYKVLFEKNFYHPQLRFIYKGEAV